MQWDGSSWGTQTSGTIEYLTSVWGSDATHLWAVSTNGTILKGNGSSWSAAALRSRPAGALISGRLTAAAGSEAYAQRAERLAVDTLQPLADLAASLYARSGNFTVLHVVTATRAARAMCCV